MISTFLNNESIMLAKPLNQGVYGYIENCNINWLRRIIRPANPQTFSLPSPIPHTHILKMGFTDFEFLVENNISLSTPPLSLMVSGSLIPRPFPSFCFTLKSLEHWKHETLKSWVWARGRGKSWEWAQGRGKRWEWARGRGKRWEWAWGRG